MTKRISVLSMVCAGMLAAGCIGNNSSLTALGMVLPDGACEGIPGGAFLPQIVVDLSVATRASAFLVVRNGMPGTLNPGTRVLENHTVLVEGVNVKYRSPFTRLAGRYVNALGSIAPNQGLSVVPFEVLSVADIDALRADAALTRALQSSNAVQVVANAKVEGRLTDGGSITSSEVPIPITLCRNCLQLPPGATGQNPDVCENGVNVALEFALYESLRRP